MGASRVCDTQQVALEASEFAAVSAGRLRTRLVDRRRTLLIETASGALAGAVRFDAPERGTTMLDAADGSWTVDSVQAVDRHRRAHLLVRDTVGAEAAAVWFEGAERIELSGESLVLNSPSLVHRRLWNYTIDGLFIARPSRWTFGNNRSYLLKRPVTIDVSNARSQPARTPR